MILKAVKDNFFTRQFLRFLLAGAFAAACNFFSRYIFQIIFSYTVSVALAFSFGTIVSFVLNRTFTFAAYDEKAAIQFLKFIIIAVVGIALAALIAFLGMAAYRLFPISAINQEQMEAVWHIAAIFLITVYNFLAMKFFSFKKIR